MMESEMIEFAEALAYNYDYKGEGLWQRKEFDDEPLVDVREYKTSELYEMWQKFKQDKSKNNAQ